MPFFGFASLLCTFVGFRFKLNIPALLLTCYLVGPLHFLLYIPFIQMGIWAFNADEFRLSLDEVIKIFRADWQQALKKLWFANLLGIIMWLVLSAPIIGVIYMLMLPVFQKLVRLPRPQEEEIDIL